MKIKIILYFLLVSTVAFAQNIQFDGVGKQLYDALEPLVETGAVEVPNESVLVENDTYYFATSFRIEEETLPDLIVSYYYNSDDNLVKKIEYEWDVKLRADSTFYPQDKAMIEAFIERYNSLHHLLDKQYGLGKVNGQDLDELHLLDEQSGLKQSVTWSEDDQEQASLSIVLRNYFHSSGKITFPTVHRIRLNIK